MDEVMIELVSAEVIDEIAEVVVVSVLSSDVVCSMVVEVGSVVDLRFVDSAVDVGAGSSTSVVWVSVLGPVPVSSPCGSDCVSAPSGPRRNGVPALTLRSFGRLSMVILVVDRQL